MENKYRECIRELCDLINYLDDSGCLLEEDRQQYIEIIKKVED